ncbi:hypothetical protein DLJ48_08390 [Oenococcus sicerae]|uniref:Uncharacterized protein n=1 Tax=Oenococcus sicerae TaxID=2203724 RepID=A0ABX5QP16_9LACO|nr:hypothetical protein [Oenococcus sicerae]QAS70539.1 hypothetical protein DLJ48_08390 [Oenococcus sicerae]
MIKTNAQFQKIYAQAEDFYEKKFGKTINTPSVFAGLVPGLSEHVAKTGIYDGQAADIIYEYIKKSDKPIPDEINNRIY